MLHNRLFYEISQNKKKKGLLGAAILGAGAGGAYLGNKVRSNLKYSKFGKDTNSKISTDPGEFSTEVPPDTRRRIEQEMLRKIQGED